MKNYLSEKLHPISTAVGKYESRNILDFTKKKGEKFIFKIYFLVSFNF
jgi:hypothetical protein